VLVLKEKIQILESQLKIKEHQPLLEKSQLDETVKRTQSILNQTREQLDQSLTTSRKEAVLFVHLYGTSNCPFLG
jgi:hypothetical protein